MTELQVDEWITVPDAAERLGVPVTRVRQMLRDGHLVGVRRDGIFMIPAVFIGEGAVLKGLPGLLTVLKDQRFTPEDAMQWLFAEDETLPGTPVQALLENRGTEIKRRAQALGW